VSESGKHLDPAQIEKLLGKQLLNREEQGMEWSADISPLRLHLAECAECRERVSIYENAGQQLDSLKTDSVAPKTPVCPDNQTILQLAAGLLESGRSETVLNHVVGCDHCGPLFRRAAVDFDDHLTDSETATLAKLKSSKLESQARLARKLAAAATPTGPSTASKLAFYGIRKPILAFAAMAAMVALAWLGLRTYSRQQPSYATWLLARSYTAQRTMEIRIPGAEFAPMRVERGQTRSRMERPAELLQAEELIATKLALTPQQPEWLQAKGRADLLDGNYEAAISSFEKALDHNPEAPDLLSDLASAYFSRAESEDKASDYAKALELYGRALQAQPDNPLVLFNRAIAFERISAYAQAIEDWERYLQADSSSPWSDEAKHHLHLLQLKQRERQNSSLLPLLQPEQIARGPQEHLHDADVEIRIEGYQNAAVQEWLAAGYPVDATQRGSSPAVAARLALAHLAAILSQKHDDRWLQELLLSSSSPQFAAAVAELGEAASASDRADYMAALQKAAAAKKRFAAIGNTAGISRAEFERIFALHFSNNALDCVRDSERLLDSLRRFRYAWISEQSRIEQGICRNLLGEFGSAATVLLAANSDASKTNYPVTAARARTMTALVQWSAGNADVAWQELYQSAANCWSGVCPAMTLYSIYANMDNFAEDSHQWHLQVALAKEAIATIGDDSDVLMRAVEHNRLAKAAVLAGETTVAQRNFAFAAELLARAPRTEVTLHYEAGINVDLAKLAHAQGDDHLAEHFLALVRPRIPEIADHYILIDYYGILSELQLQQRKLDEAETALKWAVGIAEHELYSLSSPRDRLSWMAAAKDVYIAWAQLELLRNHPESAFRIWESFLSASLRAAEPSKAKSSSADLSVFARNQRNAGPPAFPALDSPATNLLSQQTLISYAIVSGHLVAWVFDDRGLFFVPLTENVDELLPVLRRFQRDCSNSSADLYAIKNEGKYLYRRLIAPLSDHLDPGRTLLFDGEPAVVGIPLQALVDKSGHYLADSYATDNLPSIRHIFQKRGFVSLRANVPILIVSVSGSGSANQGLAHLTGAAREADMIAHKFSSARLIQDKDARPETIEREIPTAVVFHYAGHTTAGPPGNGLLLAGSTAQDQVAVLDAERIRSLRPLALQLAVLSACSTEGSGSGTQQAAQSLALAFLDSSVPHVIASRWEVDSETTTRFMSAFYDSLLSGEPVSAAVRSAAIRIRSQDGNEKPYYWAAFDSFGAP
jgi:CHAT domain-containing protein/tetratricopeptide (TPR) repeat protein